MNNAPRDANAVISTYGSLAINGHEPKADPTAVVEDLNADRLDDIQESQMLRTDADRTVTETTTVTLEGTMEVPGLINVTAGEIHVGEFILEATSNGGVSIGFK